MPRLTSQSLLTAAVLSTLALAGCHCSEPCPGRPTCGNGWVAPLRFETVPVGKGGVVKTEAALPVNPMTTVPDSPDVPPPVGKGQQTAAKKSATAPAGGNVAKTQAPATPAKIQPAATTPTGNENTIQATPITSQAPASPPVVPPLPALAMQVKGSATDAPNNASLVSVTRPQETISPPPIPPTAPVVLPIQQAPQPVPAGPAMPIVRTLPMLETATSEAPTLPMLETTMPLPPLHEISPVVPPEPPAPVVPIVHTTPALTTPIKCPEPVVAEKPQLPQVTEPKTGSEFAVTASYGHAADYSWISGGVEKWRNQWRLRYAHVDEADLHGGCVTLAGEQFFPQLRDGGQYKLQGRLAPANARNGGAVFYIEAICPR